jgi:hypothetical protein
MATGGGLFLNAHSRKSRFQNSLAVKKKSKISVGMRTNDLKLTPHLPDQERRRKESPNLSEQETK